MIEVCIKRVYDGVADNDGMRILVDKLWPRGLKKENLPYDLWAKAAAYREELKASADLRALAQQIKAENPQRVTLLYAFKNKIRNHAVVLQEELQKLLQDA